ncbi:MAG: tRNA pseudouridine(55) synthase TruB [Phycisphaerales bacterium]
MDDRNTKAESPVTPDRPIEGVIVIDKPIGMSSMQVCAVVRGRLKAGGAPKRVKVGHGGTLDPLATGVLVVLIGRATKLCERVMAGVKGYTTTIDLSQFSTTDDLEGEKTPATPAEIPSREAIEQACAAWTGEVMQTPPPYSAIKVGGKRAYAMARKGESVELKARPVRIDSIEILNYAWPMLTLDITCGKGTYIRSLGRDIGARVGAGGMLTALRRTRVGSFTLEEAVKLDAVPSPMDPWSVGVDPGRFSP